MGVGTKRFVIGKYQARGTVNLNLALSEEITDVGQACGLARTLTGRVVSGVDVSPGEDCPTGAMVLLVK